MQGEALIPYTFGDSVHSRLCEIDNSFFVQITQNECPHTHFCAKRLDISFYVCYYIFTYNYFTRSQVLTCKEKTYEENHYYLDDCGNALLSVRYLRFRRRVAQLGHCYRG
jgi:hypothetical protein